MTDNEITKALNTAADKDFVKVYLWNDKPPKIITISVVDIADLINRQNAEIEELEAEIDKQYEQAKADILGNMADGGTSCHWCINQHRAKAVKEFAERLKENKIDIDVSFGYGREHYTEAVAVVEIDNLVKEFTEDKADD